MSRTAGSSGKKTQAAIREAGLDLIYAQGFDAMSLRQLAARVGLQPGSLYNHIATKQDLLYDLIHNHMVTLLERIDAELEGIEHPLDRLKAFIAFHLTYHIERKREVFIGSAELRSLEPRNRKKIVALRRAYEDRLSGILETGVAGKLFKIDDVAVSAYAILAMLTGICTWYDPKGRIGRRELIDIHTRLVLQGVLK
ncbi:TetR/AcrR family transcriptional regulator [Parvibaculum sp.]|uniref:TetR/AcrR family transcriptional regulator n=1 Tax=Parvibaculum sp. TaxID=2024848 RepID=UPI002731262D|nr:TetR/AcrR family transcriptional regulator [Parvibaculum sp.]MDP1628383.1 TetR/AcrR family transcriptional regulator [Parvibaculum sp.]MDP2149898.1 TetR/AcrR family transcriptional regulator [Parvibaculum sp.]MDP3329496.1 TetR/AcrR family transcriptional regulator [Parvibaculum sp.]